LVFPLVEEVVGEMFVEVLEVHKEQGEYKVH
jgi:hypothetical protein